MNRKLQRPASRILLLDQEDRVLLFRFDPPDRPPFWCTPGGAVDPGENYAEAARRELLEECGIAADCGAEGARRRVEFVTLEQVAVEADERYYCVRTTSTAISTDGHTDLERQVMRGHRWFERSELDTWPERVFPEDLGPMLDKLSEDK
jgi:8-oxo-dGTP pyrophosphatase MutT (NUDIX family)